MDLTCPSCGVTTALADDGLPPEGARARCHRCGAVSIYHRGGLVADDPTPPRGFPAVSPGPSPERPAAPRPPAQHPRPAAAPVAPSGPTGPVGGPREASGPYFVRTAAGEEGPLPIEAVKRMIRDGRLGADDMVAPPDAPAWMRAGDVRELQRWLALKRPDASATAAAAPAPAEIASCTRHPGTRGRWMCSACGDLSCDACVLPEELQRVPVKLCPSCRKSCSELTETKRITPFWEEIPALLAYPVRGLGWLGLVIFPLLGIGAALAGAAAAAFAYAYVAQAFLVLTIYAYHLYIIRDTTQGGRSMPNLGRVENYQQELIRPAGKAAFISFLLFLPTIWASGAVRGARMDLGVAEGLRASVLEDKAAWERRGSEEPGAAEASAEEPGGSLEQAFQDMSESGTIDEQAMGQMMGQAFGSLGTGPDEARDFDAEVRAADGSIQEARSRLRMRQLVQGLLAAAALGIWPIFLIVVALFNTIIPVFQPQVLLKVIAEIPREYAWCSALTAGCFLGIFALNLPFRGIMLLDSWLTSPATYYLSCIAFHVMGRTAELAEQKIDWH